MPDIDLFLVAGQSNAEGRGNSATSPKVTNGSLEWDGSALVALDDPVGGASTGSAWPAFANTYGFCCITEAAQGSTNLLAASGGAGSWSTSGSLFNTSVSRANAAIAALEGDGYTVTFKGVIWHQGERDAQNYPNSDLESAYQTAFEALYDRYVAAFDDTIQLWCARVGAPDSGDTAGFQAVRNAQDAACEAVAGMHMAYTGCVDFPDLGLMSDDLHYTQVGYNTMGTAIAEHILADVPTESGLVDVNGDPIAQYQLVDDTATLFADSVRS